jgi:type II secretory pathway component GspD/PulD (secretin)
MGNSGVATSVELKSAICGSNLGNRNLRRDLVLGTLMKALLIMFVSTLGVLAQTFVPPENVRLPSENIFIKYAKASEIAEVLNLIGEPHLNASAVGRNQFQSQFMDKAGIANEPTLLGEVKITVDERMNSLLVLASSENMRRIKDIVSRLDVVLPQALIEAVIFEAPLKGLRKFGINQNKNRSQDPPECSFGLSTSNSDRLMSVSNLVSHAMTDATQPGRLRFLGKLNGDLDRVVTELASDSRVRILQRPRIQTSSGEAASIFVGAAWPSQPSFYAGGFGYGGPLQQLNRTDPNVTLEVTPVFGSSGYVLVGLQQAIETVAGTVKIENVGDVPITSKRQSQAMVYLADGDIIALACPADTIEHLTPPTLRSK